MNDLSAKPTTISRRRMVGVGVAVCVAPALSFASTYPSKPIRAIVGFVPGGSTDFGARVIAAALADVLGVPVVVENKPGATGILATDYVSKQPGDGYTLLVATPTPVIVAPQAMGTQSFDPLTQLAPINMVSTTPMAISAGPRLRLERIKDLVALSRTRQVTIGTSGLGGSLHLVIEALIQSTGANVLVVPYKGTGPTITDCIAGHIDAIVSDVGNVLPFHKEDKLKILGVTSQHRMETLPDVPTIHEDVPGLVMANWLGVFTSGKTPKDLVDKLDAALLKVVKRDDVRDQFAKSGYSMASMPNSDAFRKFVVAEHQRYGALIRDRGVVIKE